MSVRHGSFFADRRVSIAKILMLLYIWATSPTQSICSVKAQTELNEVTIIHMYNRFRDIAQNWCRENLQPMKIGGPGRIVEIDESVFYKTKYQRGRRREHDWVFGMVERGTNRLMLVPIPDRTAATLVGVIQQYIEYTTRIISDGWAAYGGLNALRVQVGNIWNQKYHHDFVNHRISFVDPFDRTIHNQSIEATWKNVAQEAGVRDWIGMPLNVTEMMEYWMNQPGFPVVSVKRNQNETTVTLTNNRDFWFATKLLYNNDGTLQSEWLFNSKLYDKDETTYYSDSYFIANVEGGAYVTVEYDENSWQKPMEQINKDPTILDSTTKAKLFVDLTYKGARSTDIKRFLDLSLTLINETSAKTWEVAIPVFQHINDMFRNHENYWMIQKYLKQLIESVLNSEIKKDWNGGILVNKLLSLLLDVTNTDQLINLPHIKHYLNCYVKNHSNSACWLDPDLRPAIYCALIRTKGSAQFDHTWLKLETEINRTHLPYFESEKDALLYGLSCTSSSTQLQKLLQYVVEHKESDVLKDIARSTYGYWAMTTFFKNKPKRAYGKTWRNKFAQVLATVSSTQEQPKNLKFLSNDRMIMKAVKSNIRWLNENENSVIGWLINHVRFL